MLTVFTRKLNSATNLKRKLMSFKTSRYGWLPGLPDHRDFLYAAPAELAGTLPSSADLRAQCPPVYEQGQLGSCTANAIAAVMCVSYDDAKQWFTVLNSWDDKWGMKGHFTLPYSYVTLANLASDFWTIRAVA
jgi:C1A family cysteine protease